MEIFNWGFSGGIKEFFAQPYTVFGGILGGAFLSMASHGTDQLIVQRLLTTKSLKAGRKAIIGSGVLVIYSICTFPFVGLGLYAYYGSAKLSELVF